MSLPTVHIPHPHVEILENGTPVVKDTKIPVRRLYAWHLRGVSAETLVKRYPRLGTGVVLDVLAFAYDNRELLDADIQREREMLGW